MLHKCLCLLLPLALYLAGCGCPPNEKVGELDLAQATKDALPYAGSEQLRFRNEAGDVLELTAPAGLTQQNTVLCVRTICTERKFDGKSTCEFFEGRARSVVFQNAAQTVVLDVAVTSGVFRPQPQEFYDYLRVALSTGNFVEQGGHITEVRFGGNFDRNQTEVQRHLTPLDSVVLNGRTFTEVLAAESSPLRFYYSTTQGLVGFATPDGVWVLE